MSGNIHCFVEWKEEFISQERGNRVVHYFLKDSSGESIRAVIGTERSVRHMFYIVAEEFVRAYGDEHSIHGGFKWRSRREVVDWLTSMLSKQHVEGDRSKSPKHDALLALRSPDCAMIEISARKVVGQSDMSHFSRNLNGHNSDIVWSGSAWTCGKHLKHFPAFCRSGTTIAVQSFVFVMAKGENHYLAYLEDMYEDKRGQKKVKVRWFHHTKEVKGVIPVRNPHPKEVFITPYSQVISAECVDGLASVLTRGHYEKCAAVFPDALLARAHVCSRQFISNKVKPFDLSKLRGYFDQPILSCLSSSLSSEPDSTSHGLNEEDEEELNAGLNVKLGNKRSRTNRSSQRFETDNSGNRISSNHLVSYGTSSKKIKYALSGKRLLSLKHAVSQYWHGSLFKVDEKIELLCQDSGIRGCWFRCTVLQVSKKQMKVQYDDVEDEDEYGNLEEWIPICKPAMPDKLGMRYSSRQTVRPTPNSRKELALEVGVAVDAWWSDGWWEGVVTGFNSSGDDNVQIYFPGENLFLNMYKKDIRISRDWDGDRWIDIEARPNIHSLISDAISPDMDTKISMSTSIMDAKVDVGTIPVEAVAAKIIAEVEKPELASQDRSDNLVEETGGKELASWNGEKDGDASHCKKSPPSENGKIATANDILNCVDNENNINNNNSNDDKEDKLEVEKDMEQNCKSKELMEARI